MHWEFSLPTLAVNMCLYIRDDPALFRLAYRSVFQQSLQPVEFVLVCDGPITPALEEAVYELQSLAKEKQVDLRILRLDENFGHGLARQAALEATTAEFVAICDADDTNHHNRFELIVKEMLDNGLDICGALVEEIDTEKEVVIGIRAVASSHDQIICDLTKRCPFNQMTVCFLRKSILDVGGYRDIYCNEDYDLWVRCALAGLKFGNLGRILVSASVNYSSYGRRGGIRYFKSELTVQRALLKASLINRFRFCLQVFLRFGVQVLLPSHIRRFIFRKFARR